MTFYGLAKGLINIYLKIFYKRKIYGADNIPSSGPVIIVANHINVFDPLVVGCSINRQVHFLAKDELFNITGLGKLIRALGAFPIKRGGNDHKAIKTGLEYLKNEKVIGIFPEGTRSMTGEIGKGLPGAALFALKSDAKVVPIGIVTEYKYFKSIIVNIGKPISLEAYKKEKITSEDLSGAISYMMEQIKKQIDEMKSQ